MQRGWNKGACSGHSSHSSGCLRAVFLSHHCGLHLWRVAGDENQKITVQDRASDVAGFSRADQLDLVHSNMELAVWFRLPLIESEWRRSGICIHDKAEGERVEETASCPVDLRICLRDFTCFELSLQDSTSKLISSWFHDCYDRPWCSLFRIM